MCRRSDTSWAVSEARASARDRCPIGSPLARWATTASVRQRRHDEQVPRRSEDRDLPIEWIDLGEDLPDDNTPIDRGGPRWRVIALTAVVAVLIAIATGVAMTVAHDRHTAQPQALPPPGTGALPQTIFLPRSVLAVPKDWELIARGPQLVRIDLRTGVVTRTKVPTLQSSGPSFMLVETHEVIIRPLDFVPGYRVADGQAAQVLRGALDNGGPAFAGPHGQVWVSVQGAARRMVLIDTTGAPTGPSLDSTDTFPVGGDGAGLLVMRDPSGFYLAGAGTPELITTGSLLAIGPTRWLTAEHTQRGCTLVVTNRATKTRHTLGSTSCANDVPFPGVISPNGRSAAIVVEAATGTDAIHLIDLRTGSDHRLTARPRVGDGSNEHLVWTPDSRTLFFLTFEGQIDFTDAQGSHVRLLPLDLQETSEQIAIRVNPSP